MIRYRVNPTTPTPPDGEYLAVLAGVERNATLTVLRFALLEPPYLPVQVSALDTNATPDGYESDGLDALVRPMLRESDRAVADRADAVLLLDLGTLYGKPVRITVHDGRVVRVACQPVPAGTA